MRWCCGWPLRWSRRATPPVPASVEVESRPGQHGGCARAPGLSAGGHAHTCVDDASAELLHLEDGERAVRGAVGQQPEGAVDTGEAARTGELRGSVALSVGAARERNRQVHCVM